MRARDIMSRPVISVDVHATVLDAVTALTEHGFAAVPVVDDGDLVVGIFSESDGLRAEDRRTAPVTAVMAVPVEVTTPDANVTTIAERKLGDHCGRCRSWRRTGDGAGGVRRLRGEVPGRSTGPHGRGVETVTLVADMLATIGWED